MRLRFIFVGQTRVNYLSEGVSDFLKRIKGYLPAEKTAVKGVKVRGQVPESVRAEDTRRLLAAIRPDDIFVHLDPNGREMTSLEFAGWIQDQMNGGRKSIAFGLGGPLGLDDTAAARANLRLCLTKMTLTHEMCRLILLEQVYRALRVNAGHPYHK